MWNIPQFLHTLLGFSLYKGYINIYIYKTNILINTSFVPSVPYGMIFEAFWMNNRFFYLVQLVSSSSQRFSHTRDKSHRPTSYKALVLSQPRNAHRTGREWGQGTRISFTTFDKRFRRLLDIVCWMQLSNRERNGWVFFRVSGQTGGFLKPVED